VRSVSPPRAQDWGTTAYFNDTESFDDNTLTAGELDLFVHVDYPKTRAATRSTPPPDGTFIDGNVVGGGEGDPSASRSPTSSPATPARASSASIVDNPAYMWDVWRGD